MGGLREGWNVAFGRLLLRMGEDADELGGGFEDVISALD